MDGKRKRNGEKSTHTLDSTRPNGRKTKPIILFCTKSISHRDSLTQSLILFLVELNLFDRTISTCIDFRYKFQIMILFGGSYIYKTLHDGVLTINFPESVVVLCMRQSFDYIIPREGKKSNSVDLTQMSK